MKMLMISSVLAPTLLFQFFLWSSPVARAAEIDPAQDSTQYTVPAEDPADFLPEFDSGEQFAACNSSNRVHIQYCRYPDNKDGIGYCRFNGSCTYSAAAYDECERDFRAVCGKVPPTYVLY